MRGKYRGGIIMCPHDFDMDICGITLKNVALSFSLVGHPWPRTSMSQIILV